ncbi:hypothetical protein DV737_g4191, partial [Chaetothyriales sp. CBS 132003]
MWALGATPDEIQNMWDYNVRYQDPMNERYLPTNSSNLGLKDPDVFEECLGIAECYPDFLKFFEDEITVKGLQEVIKEYLLKGDERADDILGRMFSDLVHPIIHLGCGIEFGQPSLVAEALAAACVHENWPKTFLLPTETFVRSNKAGSSLPMLQVLESLRKNPDIVTGTKETDPFNKIPDGFLKRVTPEQLVPYLARFQVEPEPEDLRRKMSDMMHTTAYVLAAAQRPGKREAMDFVTLHAVTFAAFFPSIIAQEWLSDHDKARLLEATVRVDAVMYAGTGCPPLYAQRIVDYVPRHPSDGWPELFKRAIIYRDEGHAVAHDLHTTPTVANLSLAFYMLAMAFSPMWWSALSEKHGRRTTYLLSFSLFLIFSCISAVSVNIAMLIAFRILSGGAAASVQSVGAGTIADIWEPKVRGRAMGIFFLGPLCGPGLAPVIGGALTQALHWRSTLWFLTIFGGVMLILIFLCLPETVARREPKPDEVLALLQYPPIIVAVWTGAISFFTMFVLNVSLQSNFEKAPYNFSSLLVGLVYLAPTIGYAFSSVFGGRWIDHIMAREARKANRYDDNGKLKFHPEDRMKENLWLALSLYPAALIWYGWSISKGLHWAVACAACIVFGLGVMLVMGAINTVLTEFTPRKSSSGVALANFLRNVLACTAPPVASGIDIANTLASPE